MDVQKKLDEIVAAVEGARSMPMSASCVINRADLLALLAEVREALPASLAEAQAMLVDREQVVAEARAEAERIIESAHEHRGSLVSGTEIARHSQEEADRILTEARREADEIRVEADDYVDSKLANFEVVLTKTIGSVDRGREKLLGRTPDGEEWFEDDEAPERTADPAELRRRADSYVDAKLGAFETVLAKTLEAVGRGRQKLTGHRPIDELAAHIAAQDAAGADPRSHQTDDEFLAHLSGAVPAQAAPAQQPPAPVAAPEPAADPYGYGQQQPEYAPEQPDYAPAAAMGYGQEAAAGYPQDVYQQAAAGYDAYGYQQQPAEYADAGGYGWQQQTGYEQQQQQPVVPHQQHYGQQPAGLDETSFFDTGMIDLNALQGPGQGH
jgi:cell division septum initiation protein DivIVA